MITETKGRKTNLSTRKEIIFPALDSKAAEEACPLRDILNRVGDKWSVLMVLLLRDGKLCFSDMRRSIEGISQRMLTHTLRQLEREGLVERTMYPTIPMRVEYELTVLGRTLIEPLSALARWAENNRGSILLARAGCPALTGRAKSIQSTYGT